ncbi:hypothetical protein HY009_02560 [Candidatus Acetothermia bacterium]|nr:hypothetical protein [Candidatus Acetothermia bacterium]
MNSVLYLFKELLFGLKPKGLRASLLAIGLMSLFFSVLIVLLLAWNLLGMNSEINVFAVFRSKPERELIQSLYSNILNWHEVAQVYNNSCESNQDCKFPGELRNAVKREELAQGFLTVVATRSQDVPSLEEKLKFLGIFSQVISYERASLRQSLAQNALAMNSAIIVLGVCLVITMIAVARAFRILQAAWAAEMATLYLAGVKVITLRIPFFLMGVLYGLLAALLALLTFYLLQTVGVGSDNPIRRWLPDVLRTDFLPQLTWRLIALGLLLGALTGGLSAFAVRVKPS